MSEGITLAIIPARGGSKSVPRKNLATVAGKPLIAWTVEAARACPAVDRVIVSTDDAEIAREGRRWGADVPFLRPAELAADATPMLPVIQHAVASMEAAGVAVGLIVLLQPTSPLRTAADIEACLEPVRAGRASAAMTVCEAEHHPFFYFGRIVEGRWWPLFPGHDAFTHRQAAPPVYRETGAVMVFRREVVMDAGTLFPPDICPVVMPVERSLDIDSVHDLRVAEALLK